MNVEALDKFDRQLRRRLRDRWNCDAPVGCLSQEIKTSQDIASKLPEVYLRFLSICGLQAGDLFREYNWSPASRATRNAELRVVSEEFDLAPPAPAFCFLDYIGDYFWCFELSGDPNPTVIRHDTGLQWVTLPIRLDTFLLTWDQLE
jgi:hypothetical protein